MNILYILYMYTGIYMNDFSIYILVLMHKIEKCKKAIYIVSKAMRFVAGFLISWPFYNASYLVSFKNRFNRAHEANDAFLPGLLI